MEKEQLLEDLFRAYFDARRNKRNTVNQLRFELNFESNLIALYNEILLRNYKISPSICFVVDKPVKREIFAADFRDRVIHHLVFNYINPHFDSLFIEDSYSCRKGKGTMYGVNRLASFIKECSNNYTTDCYILKLDIEGYFMNIDRILLQRIVHKYLEDDINRDIVYEKELIYYLLACILNDDPTKNCIIKGTKSDWKGLPLSKSLFHKTQHQGLPIGNLTSQLFSNIYLHEFDLYLKNQLEIAFYGRYVDDFVIVHSNLNYLKDLLPKLSTYLTDRLGLRIHPKKIYLQHYSKGVNFLGATIKPHRIYIANRTKRNFRNSIQKWEKRLKSGEELNNKTLNGLRTSVM